MSHGTATLTVLVILTLGLPGASAYGADSPSKADGVRLMCEQTLLGLNLRSKVEIVLSTNGSQAAARNIGASTIQEFYRGSTSETQFSGALDNGVTLTIDRLSGDYQIKDRKTGRRWVGNCKPATKIF